MSSENDCGLVEINGKCRRVKNWMILEPMMARSDSYVYMILQKEESIPT